MLGKLKTKATDLLLKSKEWFASSEPSTTYVKDLRRVMTCPQDGRKCQYPKNYDEIVKSGEIIDGVDEYGKPIYKLLYGKKDKNGKQPIFNLALVKEASDRSYFTLEFLVNKKENKGVKHYSDYYEPFGFSKMDLRKYVPIFEAQKTKNSHYLFELTNSSVLVKKGFIRNDKGEIDEKDRDEKGRNGQLLYTSDYKKLNTSFFEIKDQNNNLELDKSLISVPVVFAAGLAKVFAKCLTYLPMKLGEYLIGKQNPIVKIAGYILFTPAAAVKNLVNVAATLLKLPICAFVANKKKYGDAYYTIWKHQLKECFKEATSDYAIVKNGKRVEHKEESSPEFNITATWDELNAKRQDIEKKLEENNKGTSETLSRSQSLGSETLSQRSQSLGSTETLLQQSQNSGSNESVNHADRVQNRRNSQTGGSRCTLR